MSALALALLASAPEVAHAQTAPAAAPSAAPAAPSAAPSSTEPAPAPPPAAAPAPATSAPATSAPAPATSPLPLWPEPASDASALQHQGDTRPKPKTLDEVTENDHVYAEDWWSHARPILEMHGYYRVRTQLDSKFSLGRIDPRNLAMWPRPADDAYVNYNNLTGQPTGASVCTESESGVGASTSDSTAQNPCHSQTQIGADMRLRLNPELHISDNLRIYTQIDLLDNIVLGSTPSGYYNVPSTNGGYTVGTRNGYAPLGFYDDTMVPPQAGVNSTKNSIEVKRVWAEYALPIGEIRFGRMPFHWGLGMLFNAGDGHDDDAQSTVDRIQLVSGIKPLDLYFSAAVDFPNEGITSDALALPNPEPYDLAQLDDVDQYVISVMRKKAPQLERQALTRGDVVLNGGLQLVYRHQTIANDRTATINSTGSVNDDAGSCTTLASTEALRCPVAAAYNPGSYVRRDATAWIPDLFVELKYKKFRFAAEFATVQGSIANISTTSNTLILTGDPGYSIHAYGVATELEQKLVEDKLNLGFKFGWASGDQDVDGLAPVENTQQLQGLQDGGAGLGDRTFSTFRFHPSYRVDLILGRQILTREEGTYYFRPSADYDFLRDPNGQRVGGGLAAIWTRASEFMQAPGHERDLGIELDGKVYYQSKDGALNDIPGVMGGFYTEVDYGVLFPMAGLGYPDQLKQQIQNQLGTSAADIKIAQTLRWYLGVIF
ncbi:MAG TPA: TIGR04551 family protein [Polyangiaceae bacterium]|nr:TIGR04551 family protein [Polyangiaceae bacterium]